MPCHTKKRNRPTLKASGCPKLSDWSQIDRNYNTLKKLEETKSLEDEYLKEGEVSFEYDENGNIIGETMT